MVNTEEDTGVQGMGDVEPLLTEEHPCVQFLVGDIVWAKVFGYPWWPCMITTDPEFNIHFRQNSKVQSSVTLIEET